MNSEETISKIRNQLKQYTVDNNLKALVLGISGGIDSALVAALARPVCDEIGIPLIGRSLPIETNTSDEISIAKMVGEAFCTDFIEESLSHMYEATMMTHYGTTNLPDANKETKIAVGNIKARLRMIHLYHLAGINKGLVIGTTNYTEALLDFYTIGGDGQADYEPLFYYWKTEVYELAKYLAAKVYSVIDEPEKINALFPAINAVATDGLGISKSDLEQLGADSYEQVDKILKTWLCDDEDKYIYDEIYKFEKRLKLDIDKTGEWDRWLYYRNQYKDHPVIKRYLKSFKGNLPICPDRI